MNVFDLWVIPLTKGKVTVVDKDTFLRLKGKKWCVQANKYAGRKEGGRKNTKMIYMHREIAAHHGFNIDGMDVDHIDGDPFNNTLANLRVCTHRQNGQNQKLPSSSSTGFKGVSRDGRKYRAHISPAGKYLHLGNFDTPEDAHEAYRKAAIEHHGEFARFN